MPPQRSEVGLREMMAGFPTGVSIVTAVGPDGVPRGMTCTSLVSVSLDPPTILICLRCGSPTLAAVLAGGVLAVNLLRVEAQPTAELFGSGAPGRFDLVDWTVHPGGAPHLPAVAHTIADCRLSETMVVGDHAVVVAEVERVTSRTAPDPLLYGMRRYGQWTDARPDGTGSAAASGASPIEPRPAPR